jgi:hypothetical protein
MAKQLSWFDSLTFLYQPFHAGSRVDLGKAGGEPCLATQDGGFPREYTSTRHSIRRKQVGRYIAAAYIFGQCALHIDKDNLGIHGVHDLGGMQKSVGGRVAWRWSAFACSQTVAGHASQINPSGVE